MLKRLLVAVFVLGLLLAFSSTAFSGPIGGRGDLERTSTRNVSVPVRPGISDWANVHPDPSQRIPVPEAAPFGAEFQTPASPDTTGCAVFDYTNFAACGYYVWWTTSSAGASGNQFSMRFDIPPNHSVNVVGAGVRIYAIAGAPQLVISVYADNAGIPGALLYSQAFAPATGNVIYNFTTPVNITNGGPYHIGTAVAGGAADSIRLGSDDGVSGTERGSINIGGTWFPNAAVTFGTGCGGVMTDPNWRIRSSVCQYYSSCGVTMPGGTYFRDGLPDAAWSDGSVMSGTGQRFKAEGPETLNSIRFVHRVVSAANYTASSTNYLIIKVWGDSAGYARLTPGPLVTTTVPAGLANLFPVGLNANGGPGVIETLDIPIPGSPVMIGYYHVTVEMSSLNPADGTIQFRFGDGSSEFGGGMVKFTPPGSGREWDNIAGNAIMVSDFYGDNTGDVVPCDIHVNTCKDEFSDCKTYKTYDAPAMWNYTMLSGSNIVEWAHAVKASPINRVEKLRFQVEGTGTVGLTAKIWTKSPTGPGALIYSQAVASPTFAPGWTEVVIPGGIQILGDFYIGYEGIFPNPATDTLFGLTEDFYLTSKNGGAWLNYVPAAGWIPITDFDYFDNLMAEADFCSLPVTERVCVTENDWPTFQHDYARTGASNVAIGTDAYCRMTLGWSRIRPTGRGVNLNGPIIWNDYVICAFSAATVGTYEVFNLKTGVTVYSFTDAAWGGDQSVIGVNLRCTPTIDEIDIGGTPKPVLFLAGGNPGSISAFDLSAGFPPTKLWTYNQGGGMGQTRYGNMMIVDVGGTQVLFVADDLNQVHAVVAETGLWYTGWAAPYVLSYSSQKGGATDGNSLFYSLYNVGGNSKVTAVKVSDGTMAWEFTALQGASLFTGVTIETFEAGAAYADGEVFANSRILDGTPTTPMYRRGVFYRLNATTGAQLSAVAGERARTTTPVVDRQRVIVTTLPAVVAPSASGGEVVAFSRADGSMDYSTTSFTSAQNGGQMGYFVEGLLTCEPDSSDYFWAFNIAGYLSCFKADNGDEIFHRRVDHAGANQGGVGALGRDSDGKYHLIYTSAYGGLFNLVDSVPRARLELLAGSGAIAVPFGSPADTVVEFPDMYTNTGCIDLKVYLRANATSNGTTVPAPSMSTIGSRLNENSSSLADMLSFGANSFGDQKRLGRDLASGEFAPLDVVDTRETYNQSAAATPAFLVENGTYTGDVFDPPGGGLILAPGDTVGIRVHANGPLVNRGPNSFYVVFDSIIGDPDYYLDNVNRRPEVALDLVGGCLGDTTTLHFGQTGTNIRLVSNTSILASARWHVNATPAPGDPYGFKIDNMIDMTFAGMVLYAVSNRRVAFHANAWDGSTDQWISSQGDPNYCDLSCTPRILTDTVSLGAISTDGINYLPISGSVVCKSMIDSVQNFAIPGPAWTWDNYTSPFDNDSTMGLAVNARVIGVTAPPAAAVLLNNMTLDIWELTERNNRALLNWKIGAYIDNDMKAIIATNNNTFDTTLFDQAHSLAWATAKGGTEGVVASGFVKIPFGCGYSPMKNVTAVDQDKMSYGPYWDSLYVYMSKPAGAYDMGVRNTAQDEASLYTFAEHDFTPGETYTFGYAFFAFNGLANAFSSTGTLAPLAVLVNKWAGFGRGDINDDGVINLTDIIRLAEHVNYAEPGPIPFRHLGDVDASGGVPSLTDVQYLVDYYFNYGPCPKGDWVL